jgi:hypothetical protein
LIVLWGLDRRGVLWSGALRSVKAWSSGGVRCAEEQRAPPAHVTVAAEQGVFFLMTTHVVPTNTRVVPINLLLILCMWILIWICDYTLRQDLAVEQRYDTSAQVAKVSSRGSDPWQGFCVGHQVTRSRLYTYMERDTCIM